MLRNAGVFWVHYIAGSWIVNAQVVIVLLNRHYRRTGPMCVLASWPPPQWTSKDICPWQENIILVIVVQWLISRLVIGRARVRIPIILFCWEIDQARNIHRSGGKEAERKTEEDIWTNFFSFSFFFFSKLVISLGIIFLYIFFYLFVFVKNIITLFSSVLLLPKSTSISDKLF